MSGPNTAPTPTAPRGMPRAGEDQAPQDSPELPRPRGSTETPTGQTGRTGATAPTSGLAWLVRSVTHVPGVLHLADGRLRFVSTRGVLFDATPQDLALAPVRSGRGGFRVTVGGERLRLHVVRFSGAVDVAGWLCDREGVGTSSTLGEPEAGAVWRDLVDAGCPASAGQAEIRLRGWRSARARRACAGPGPWC